MTVVATRRNGSLELYAEQICRRSARRLEVVRCGKHCRSFGVPLASRAGAAALRDDLALVARLRRTEGLVHLTNQHLARYGPFLGRPYVVTVHDLIRLRDCASREPLIHSPNRRDRVLLRLDASGIRRAAAVIAVSEATARALERDLGIPRERIAVVHQGVDHDVFRPTPRRLVPEPYVLFVGSEQPRKNLARLLEAFARVKAASPGLSVRLVKVGDPGSGEADFRSATLAAVHQLGLEDDVIFTGRVPGEDLRAYYAGARCLALPSLSEGFGLPPLEAMASGCAVVAAETAALREVAGNAALFVDPYDTAGIADAIQRLVRDARLRDRLREAGRRRAAAFSWDRTVRETERVYELVEASRVTRSHAGAPAWPPRDPSTKSARELAAG